jgi:Pyruvate/2-oxoacid:ferredoxin oxidoreductase delta subunit
MTITWQTSDKLISPVMRIITIAYDFCHVCNICANAHQEGEGK